MGGKTLKGKAYPHSNDSNIDVKREDDKLVDEDILQGTPFHVVPVVLLPRLLQVGLGLVFFVGLDSEVARQINEAEDKHGGSDSDSKGTELEGSFVLDVFWPY